MGTSWHAGGMFIGMHGVWWILWLLTLRSSSGHSGGWRWIEGRLVEDPNDPGRDRSPEIALP